MAEGLLPIWRSLPWRTLCASSGTRRRFLEPRVKAGGGEWIARSFLSRHHKERNSMITKVGVLMILKNKSNFRLPTNRSAHELARNSSPFPVRAGGKPKCQSWAWVAVGNPVPSGDIRRRTDPAGASPPRLDLRSTCARKLKLVGWGM